MSCPRIVTGEELLSRVIEHIDCQAQLIGSYGYLALGQPGSVAATLASGLLTLFVALFAIRLLFGPAPGARDVVFDVIKIGIVLTLAFSWPAFRTVIYDVTLEGPAEIAYAVTSSSGLESSEGLVGSLQEADRQMVLLGEWGTGRNVAQPLNNRPNSPSYSGTALQDDSALGLARLAFLAGTIGSLALLRIAGGVLLALAPIVAGALLFTHSRGIFLGWARALVLIFAGSVGAAVLLSVEVAMLRPWLLDALNVRSLGYATPSAPVELLALTLAFALVKFAMIWLLARMAFFRGMTTIPMPKFENIVGRQERPVVVAGNAAATQPAPSRIERISNSVSSTMRRENNNSDVQRTSMRTLERPASTASVPSGGGSARTVQSERLGSSYRRNAGRHSQARSRRDSGT